MLFTLRIDPDLHEHVREAAFKHRKSMAQIVREAIVMWLKREGVQ